MNKTYNKTVYACFAGNAVQAIVNNFVPLLFLTLQRSYHIPLSKITMLITFNFTVQLLVDLAAVGFVDRIGYRASMVIAHFSCTIGLGLLTFLPSVLSDPFVGLLISVMIYAVGGGLLEVLINPIVEACPSDNKVKALSLMHSFYCWGHVMVVMLSTAFFALFGIHNWKILTLIWAIVPLMNAINFMRVPIAPLIKENEIQMPLKKLLTNRMFWILMLLMFCAGACEQSVSQWASTFAEKGLNVTKAIGDLAGPMCFAILMGTSRAIYGKYGEKINLHRFMNYSGFLCLITYLLISLTNHSVLGFIGCGLCGLSVGILWPGTFSIAAVAIRNGGTAMYALMALAGDLGCSGGPTFVGIVSSAFQENLKKGILFAVIFPVVLLVGLYLCKRMISKERDNK